jgi:hypothetical protein
MAIIMLKYPQLNRPECIKTHNILQKFFFIKKGKALSLGLGSSDSVTRWWLEQSNRLDAKVDLFISQNTK